MRLWVPACLLGELLRDEGLAASRRTVEQHAVRDALLVDQQLQALLSLFLSNDLAELHALREWL